MGGDAEQVTIGEGFTSRDVGDTVHRGQHHLVVVQHCRLHAGNPIRSKAELEPTVEVHGSVGDVSTFEFAHRRDPTDRRSAVRLAR